MFWCDKKTDLQTNNIIKYINVYIKQFAQNLVFFCINAFFYICMYVFIYIFFIFLFYETNKRTRPTNRQTNIFEFIFVLYIYYSNPLFYCNSRFTYLFFYKLAFIYLFSYLFLCPHTIRRWGGLDFRPCIHLFLFVLAGLVLMCYVLLQCRSMGKR